MRIDYISHACLLIDSGTTRLATDPWWVGPCYARQWHLFPRPIGEAKVGEANAILISHGHEDHLHEPTLRTLAAGKAAYYPYHWYGGTPQWLAAMGFAPVIEAASGRSYRIGDAVVTFLVCGHDAIIVVEAGGRVLVNVNDALHATSQATIDRYAARIRARWPRIDYLFCGYGGASYFPNVFHAPDKDDAAIGQLRETYFVDAFCRIVAGLEPEVAVPFAADFVLLDPAQRWINEIRFPRERIGAFFDAHHRSPGMKTRIVTMYPGDAIEAGELLPASPYRSQMRAGSLDHLIDHQYPEPVSGFAGTAALAPAAATLAADLARHITRQAGLRPRADTEGLRFSLELGDLTAPNCFEVGIADRRASVTRRERADPCMPVRIRTSARVLCDAMREDWGGDALIIGYACEIDAATRAALPRARVAAELLVRHPHPLDYARRHPVRALRHIGQAWSATLATLVAKLRRRPVAEDRVHRDAWLTGDAGHLRARLSLPEVPACGRLPVKGSPQVETSAAERLGAPGDQEAVPNR